MNKKKNINVDKNKKRYLILGIGVLIILVFSFFALQNSASPTVSVSKEISVEEAYQDFKNGEYILDVRQPEEFEAGHIPGSILIPLDVLETRLSELPKNEKIVVVCRSGNRSATGRDILLNAGFETVTSMAGGMNEWVKNGYETVVGP